MKEKWEFKFEKSKRSSKEQGNEMSSRSDPTDKFAKCALKMHTWPYAMTYSPPPNFVIPKILLFVNNASF